MELFILKKFKGIFRGSFINETNRDRCIIAKIFIFISFCVLLKKRGLKMQINRNM